MKFSKRVPTVSICLTLLQSVSPHPLLKPQSQITSFSESELDRPEIELPMPPQKDSQEEEQENSIMFFLNFVDDLIPQESKTLYKRAADDEDSRESYAYTRENSKYHNPIENTNLGGIKPDPRHRQPRNTQLFLTEKYPEFNQQPYSPPKPIHYYGENHKNNHYGHRFNHPNQFHYPRTQTPKRISREDYLMN